MQQTHRYFIGLDLGQAQDYTALAVLERPTVSTRDPPHRRRPAYALRPLRRFPLGTPYPEVVADVRRLLVTPPLPGALLGVDLTGVGRAVAQALWEGLQGRADALIFWLTLTAGHDLAAGQTSGLNLPKKE